MSLHVHCIKTSFPKQLKETNPGDHEHLQGLEYSAMSTKETVRLHDPVPPVDTPVATEWNCD